MQSTLLSLWQRFGSGPGLDDLNGAALFYLQKRRLDRLRRPGPKLLAPGDPRLDCSESYPIDGESVPVPDQIAKRLSASQLELLRARWDGCCSVKALARRLGTSPSAVRGRMARLRSTLREVFEAWGIDPGGGRRD